MVSGPGEPTTAAKVTVVSPWLNALGVNVADPAPSAKVVLWQRVAGDLGAGDDGGDGVGAGREDHVRGEHERGARAGAVEVEVVVARWAC